MHSAMPSRLGCELGATVSAVRAAGLGAKVVKDLNLNLPTVVISKSVPKPLAPPAPVVPQMSPSPACTSTEEGSLPSVPFPSTFTGAHKL